MPKSLAKKSPNPTARKTKHGLTLQREEFCKTYVSPDKEVFGSGTYAYMQVYGDEYEKKNGKPMTYNVAATLGSRLLRNPKVIKRINELLEAEGFTDENVDKQHLFLINQHADLKSKLGAIKEYNALRRRVSQDTPEGKKELHLHFHKHEEIKKKYEQELEDSLRSNET